MMVLESARLRRVAMLLERVVPRFPAPKRGLEQYRTPPELALRAALLLSPCTCRIVVDLGAGTGMLSYAVALLQGVHVVAVEVDADALHAARGSQLYSALLVDLVQADATRPPLRSPLGDSCIVSNPPFGLYRRNRGLDFRFSRSGLGLGPRCLVFFHHGGTSGRGIERLYGGHGYRVECVCGEKFMIPMLYGTHRRRTYYTAVKLVRVLREGVEVWKDLGQEPVEPAAAPGQA